ncbi:MAG: histidine phosphatase family protein [Pseudomonadales bacterium]
MFEHPNRRRIFLMRHAEAAYVAQDGNIAADERVVSLTERGRAQAAKQAEVLAPVRFDKVITSNLPRTQETARIALGNRSLPIESIAALEEVRPGWQNVQDALTPEARRDWVALVSNPWVEAHNPAARFLGGETFGEFEARVLPAWNAVLADRSWTTLLAVLHGAVNRLLIHTMFRLPWGEMGIEQDNACINVIDVDDEPRPRVILRMLNFTNYNPAKEGLWLTTMEEAAERIAKKMLD